MRTVTLQDEFAAMHRDVARDQLPRGACWNLVDYIPGLDAPLGKRGGWAYASNDISLVKPTASYVVCGEYVPFATGTKNCAIDEDGELYTIASDGTVTDIGAAVAPVGRMAFHREKLIIPASNGTTAPRYYDGATLGALAGSPPAGIYATVYKDRAVLLRTAANTNRAYFSGAGDPTSWDTTNAWQDLSFPLTGAAALRNALIMFSQQRVERITGSTPPPASDFVKQTLFEPGCQDARSVVIYEDTCVFANQEGVYQTDGAWVTDLTKVAGLKRYWSDQVAAWASTWSIAAGRLREYVLISVLNGSTVIDGFMFDLPGRRAWRISNLPAVFLWSSVGAAAQTYFASRVQPRVGGLVSMFSPAGGVKNDANGTAVTPVLETGFFQQKAGLMRIRDLYATYDLRDAAADNPTLTCAYVTSPEQTSYTTMPDVLATAAPLGEVAAVTRERLSIREKALGFAVKLSQSNASAATRLHKLEATLAELEPTRR